MDRHSVWKLLMPPLRRFEFFYGSRIFESLCTPSLSVYLNSRQYTNQTEDGAARCSEIREFQEIWRWDQLHLMRQFHAPEIGITAEYITSWVSNTWRCCTCTLSDIFGSLNRVRCMICFDVTPCQVQFISFICTEQEQKTACQSVNCAL